MVLRAEIVNALLLTSIGAAGTALGGLLVVAQPKLDFKRLGYLQGLAAGLMLCISVFDLVPAAVEEVGFASANAWFFAGVIFFAVIVALIPEPDSASLVIDDSDDAPPTSSSNAASVKTKAKSPVKAKSSDDEGPKRTGSGASAGGKVAAATRAQQRAAKKRVLLSGLIMALGIALHNFPEGVAVFLASMKSHSIGLSLALAIALHNVPEGVAVALPVYFATGSRLKGFQYAFISGLAEPLAVVVLALCFPDNLSRSLVEKLLAAVGGIMAFLSVHELLPLSIEHVGRTAASLSMFAGMMVMSVNLFVLDHWIMGGEGHGHSH